MSNPLMMSTSLDESIDSSSQPIVRRATAEEVWPLRHTVLRTGLLFDTAMFDGDFDDTTQHFGTFDDSNVLCCLSLFQSTWNDSDAWQLRGMATAATHRRQGLGQMLLMFAIDAASQEKPSWPFWCNARTVAIDFYEQAGWSTETDVFDIPMAGPHVKMHYVAN